MDLYEAYPNDVYSNDAVQNKPTESRRQATTTTSKNTLKDFRSASPETEQNKEETTKGSAQESKPYVSKNQSIIHSYSDTKPDALKYFMYALIISLGLAIHTLFDSIIQRYSYDTMMTRHQVFLMRIFYILGLFIVIWSLKVLYIT